MIGSILFLDNFDLKNTWAIPLVISLASFVCNFPYAQRFEQTCK